VSFDQSKWVWSKGRLIAWDDASVHISAHTLHLGSGVFEAIRCYDTDDGPSVFRLDAHLKRLYDSASIYGIEIPYTLEELTQAVDEIIWRNGLNTCYLRVLCYHGSGSLGVFPSNCPIELTILAWPLGAYLGSQGLEHGVRITISRWVKFHSRMMPTTAKACGQYLNSLLAFREALEKGYEEAILLNEEARLLKALVKTSSLFEMDACSLTTKNLPSCLASRATRSSGSQKISAIRLPSARFTSKTS